MDEDSFMGQASGITEAKENESAQGGGSITNTDQDYGESRLDSEQSCRYRSFSSVKLKRAAWMANTYWQMLELKIITTCANSSCKCDARFNLVDIIQKKEFVSMYCGNASLSSGRDSRTPLLGSETPSFSQGCSAAQGHENVVEQLRIEDPLVRKLVGMQKRSRMTDEEILNAVKNDIFLMEISSLVDDVISAQNAEELERRSIHLKSAITHRLLRDRVMTVETALSVVKKKVYQKSRAETLRGSKDFGALDVPSGDFTIPPSSYGPGGDLSALYTRLQRRSRVPSSTSEYVNFFNKFIHHVVSEMYSRDVWPRLTARTRKRKNQYVDFDSELAINFVKAMYEKANKEVRTSFYFDVFHMITVALTNFRRNRKSQEAAEQSTSSAANDNDTIPSRPSSQSTDGGLQASQRSVDSAESDASMALSFFDYSQE